MKYILLVLLYICGFNINAQECSEKDAEAFQEKMNMDYGNPAESPLTAEDIEKFAGLEFYPVNMDYCIQAEFVRTPHEKPFEMTTTTARRPLYVKYGEVHFILDGKECSLDIFQNIELVKSEEYKNHLFLPFTDLTSGDGSYGGGRYIDVAKPAGNTMIIDFNRAYNPYCAYNYKYSCPVTPQQNDLKVKVMAGVKDYKN